MSDEELIQLIKKAALLPEEAEQWTDVITELDQEERAELVKMLEMQLKEKGILANKQANELSALRASWNMPKDND